MLGEEEGDIFYVAGGGGGIFPATLSSHSPSDEQMILLKM